MEKNPEKRKFVFFIALVTLMALACLVVASPDAAQAASVKTTYTIKAKKVLVPVRAKANPKAKKKTALVKGKAVRSTTRKKGSDGVLWYKVTVGKKTGYVSSKQVKLASTAVSYPSSAQFKVQVNTESLYVRTGPGMKKSTAGSLTNGQQVTVKGYQKNNGGLKWYRITHGKKTRYIAAKYTARVREGAASSGATLSTGQFESDMANQGFPDSYKPYLRALHKAHPKWIFKAQKTGISWSDLLTKEYKAGNNLVRATDLAKYKSKESPHYNAKTKTYKVYDGDWNQASKRVIRYYLDPRNFLNDTGIYQFMTHKFDASSQNDATLQSLLSMNSSCTWNTKAYRSYLYDGGASAKVNPNVLAAMLVMEQGWVSNSPLITGKVKGYQGIYNHFNIGAYTTPFMNKVTHGLWWAKGEGIGRTSYGRPWNSKKKSIRGGALFYKEGYMDKKQYTYYTKKFNVMNGLSNVATHEYMTNVYGAHGEGKILKYAYRKKDDYPNVFYIPIYSGMPASPTTLP